MEYLKILFSFAQNNVLYFYFVPLVLSLIGFTATSYSEYKDDLHASKTEKIYVPSIKIGTLVGRFVIAILPFINIGSALYKLGSIAYDIKIALEKALDIPLVPKPKNPPVEPNPNVLKF